MCNLLRSQSIHSNAWCQGRSRNHFNKIPIYKSISNFRHTHQMVLLFVVIFGCLRVTFGGDVLLRLMFDSGIDLRNTKKKKHHTMYR